MTTLFKKNVRKYNEIAAQLEDEGFEISPNENFGHKNVKITLREIWGIAYR